MMNNRILLCFCLVLVTIITTSAQVKIGNNPTTIDANSLLELESTNKGFLPPRVAINDVNAVAPLTGTVPTGMLVYSSGGTVTDGYYYWTGSKWEPFINAGERSITAKSATATLTKTETFVIASGNITLTLPAVTAADNGLSITIKNIGTYTDEVDVVGNGGATIDGTTASSKHFRWMAKTYIANGGNWIIKGENKPDNVLEVSATGSWTTIDEAIEFLDMHMAGPSVIKLVGGDYEITSTITIDLLYPLTIQGSSYGTSNIIAGSGLGGSPMFSCLTESYFKMLAFDATTLAGYGGSAGEDAIQLVTGGEYFEIKDCTFDSFNKAVVAQSNIEMWVFEVDFMNAVAAGIELAAGVTSGVSLKISEVDFIDCAIGINFLSGTEPIVSVLNCGFYNTVGSGVGINYEPTTFTALSNVFITNNTWNNEGQFMAGFDFSRADGRDADTFIRNNSGGQDKNPHCRINVNNNSTATSIPTAGTWYKAAWTNTSSTTTKWTISDNRITYQPVNGSDGWAIITGNITVPSNNRTISIAIIKNGVTTTRFGETDLRLSTAGQPYQFATTIYLTDIGPGDYFELFCTSGTSGETVTFQDVQWFTETK